MIPAASIPSIPVPHIPIPIAPVPIPFKPPEFWVRLTPLLMMIAMLVEQHSETNACTLIPLGTTYAQRC